MFDGRVHFQAILVCTSRCPKYFVKWRRTINKSYPPDDDFIVRGRPGALQLYVPACLSGLQFVFITIVSFLLTPLVQHDRPV